MPDVAKPMCQSCRVAVAVVKQPTANGRHYRWKCKACAERTHAGFIKIGKALDIEKAKKEKL